MNEISPTFSRREREIMNIVYRLKQATAQEVMQNMTAPPSYSAVRATLAILERRCHLHHMNDGNRYVFVPTLAREEARVSALRQVLSTFFDGSIERAVATLIEESETPPSEDELERLSALIDQTRKEGR